MMQLHINGDPEQVVWLRRSNYLIGRSNACNLRFPDQDLELVHAHLKVRDDALTLVAQDNARVEVNGAPLKEEAKLGHGDQVRLGNVQFAVVDPTQNEAPEPRDEGQTRISSRVNAENEEASSSWLLHGLSSGLAGKRYCINGSTVVGRGQECEVRLAEAHLSRRHARLAPSGDGLVVEDLQSSNGTFVNGRRVTRARLKNGDELSLDTVKFRIIHLLADDDSEETVLHGAEGKQKPTRPVGPTAIDIQRAAVRRMRDDYEGHVGVMHPQGSGSRAVESGWLAVTTVIVVLVGALWGARSFLSVPFLG